MDPYALRFGPYSLLLASGPAAYGGGTGITFDRFVRACVVVKTLTEAFQRCGTNVCANVAVWSLISIYRVDTDRDGWIQINYEEFMKVRAR